LRPSPSVYAQLCIIKRPGGSKGRRSGHDCGNLAGRSSCLLLAADERLTRGLLKERDD
jgi:hypothetical protein